ncbi:hypothetical protein TCE0_015f03170 [Talaromyces pinophilus]|uniref:Uncharacterized protein n=1 Tax=Talaromyces pinophilus TaxID=128442 RepID=A0A6V8H4J8_TALPI|nr:hypothetical protein TCE0_015f03170 [Talaromyces pinophilus]
MQWPPNIPEYLEPHSPLPSNSSSSPLASVAAVVPPPSNVSSALQHISYPHTSSGPSPSFVTYQHNPSLPLLHVAARSCKQAVIRVLLRRGGAIADEHDGEGRTALHIAAELGDGVIVSLLLDHGADPRVRDSVGGMHYIVPLKGDTARWLRWCWTTPPGSRIVQFLRHE